MIQISTLRLDLKPTPCSSRKDARLYSNFQNRKSFTRKLCFCTTQCLVWNRGSMYHHLWEDQASSQPHIGGSARAGLSLSKLITVFQKGKRELEQDHLHLTPSPTNPVVASQTLLGCQKYSYSCPLNNMKSNQDLPHSKPCDLSEPDALGHEK